MVTGGAAAFSRPVLGSSEKTCRRFAKQIILNRACVVAKVAGMARSRNQ